MGDRSPFGLTDRTIRYIAAPIAAVVFCIMAFLPQVLGLTVGDTIIYACLVPLFWYVIVHPEGVSGRVLNNRAVAHIGLLSFSIYLLHRLVLGLVEQVVHVAPVIDGLSLVVVIALAHGMYIAVEKPLAKVRKSLESWFPS